MPTNDSRLYYLRLTKAGFSNIPVKQAFLDNRPLVKTPGDEETDPVHYTEADGLTLLDYMRLLAPHRVALYREEGGKAREHLGTLDRHPDALPDDMTHAVAGLPEMTPEEIEAVVLTAQEVGQPIREVLIHFARLPEYLEELPN